MAKLLEIISPLASAGGGEAFNPLEPVLARTSLPAVEKAKCFLEAVVSFSLVPLCGQGGARAAEVEEFVVAVETLCAEIRNDESKVAGMDAVLLSCLATAQCASAAVGALLNPRSLNATAKLKEVWSARDGCLYVLKQVLTQNPHYRKLESSVRATEVAALSMLPQIQEMEQKLKSGANEATCQEVLTLLPRYNSALRPGATTSMQKSLLAALQELAGKAEDDQGGIDSLASKAQLCKDAATVLMPDFSQQAKKLQVVIAIRCRVCVGFKRCLGNCRQKA